MSLYLPVLSEKNKDILEKSGFTDLLSKNFFRFEDELVKFVRKNVQHSLKTKEGIHFACRAYFKRLGLDHPVFVAAKTRNVITTIYPLSHPLHLYFPVQEDIFLSLGAQLFRDVLVERHKK